MQNRTFRLFVSSTFSDFTQERSLLQTIVFPEIKKYCSSNKLTFQPIDLRWGVSSEAQLDQKTLELCLNEVKSSKLNPHPNFLIMSGDRYGWIPLPYLIEEKEFNSILECVENIDDKKLLNTWYKLDENQLPASYILNERKDEYVEYSSWEEVEINLRNILQIAVNKSNLTNEQKNRYFTSATEAEAIEGIFKYLNKTPFQNKLLEKDNELENKDYENVYAYIRNIKSIDNLNDKFIDKDLTKVNNFKNEIKKSIDNKNILESNVNLINVSQDEKNGSLAYSYDEIKDKEDSIFVKTMINNLKKSIDIFVSQIKDISNDEIEKYEQIRFKDSKLKDFLPNSRTKALEKIENYISSNENQTLVIYGKSGLGKSSLMAKAIQNAEDKYNTSKKIIYRFVGSTANLSDTPTLLISILKDLNIQEEIKTISNPQTMKEEPEKIEEFYYRCYSHLSSLKTETIIFIDAIDQINNKDEFLWLPKTLPNNVKIIISALEDEKYPEDSIYFETLKTKIENLYPLEAFENPIELINSLLSQYNRTITEKQMEYLLSKEDSNSPLYLSIATQELIHWKSYDDSQILASTQKEIIKEFTQNLTTLFHHDKEFVKRVFTYLYLSKGLSESELLEIISIDEEFISIIAPETYHNNDTKELPIVIWARLHTQIKEFLKLEQKDNQETMNFFHREFNDVIKNQKDIKETHEQLISLLQKLIVKYQNENFNSNRWGTLYIEIVKDYHIVNEFSYLPDDNSNLKKYAEFFSKEIVNENYLQVVFNGLNNIGLELQKINKAKETNLCMKINYFHTYISYKKNPQRWAKDYTTSLNNLATSLKSIGETLKAVELESKSLEIIKKLYKENPQQWAKDYIISLNNLAYSLESIEETSKAIDLQTESLDIIKELYKENPQKWVELYTTNLNNLAASLKSIGETLKAIKLESESLEINKELHKDNPQRWAENYLINLNNLAGSLVISGETSKAIDLQTESLDNIKELYKENPQEWVEFYTTNLNNLAASLKSIGETLKAIKLESESLEINKELHKDNPQRWAENYLINLNNLAGSLGIIGETSKAIDLQTESLDIIKELYKENPQEWVEFYTTNLNNLAASLKSIGETSKAIELETESLEINKELYKENPQRWAKQYTISLNDLAKSLEKIGETSKAIDLQTESLDNIKELYKENPQEWVEFYTTNLNNLAASLKSIGETSKAIELETESLEINKELYKDNPQRWAKQYTISLNNLANSLGIIGETSKAIDLQIESLDIIKELYKENPQEWVKHYAINLNNLATSIFKRGDSSNAIELLSMSFEISKKSYNENPQKWADFFINNLVNLTMCLKDIGQTASAIKLYIDSLEFLKMVYKKNPQKLVQNYVTNLYNISYSLMLMGETSVATKLFKEALEILKELDEKDSQLWIKSAISQIHNVQKIIKRATTIAKITTKIVQIPIKIKLFFIVIILIVIYYIIF